MITGNYDGREFPGFESQEEYWTCGPHSLRHSLLMMGSPVTLGRTIRSTGALSDWGAFWKKGKWSGGGADTYQIVAGIKRNGYKAREFEVQEAEKAKKTLDTFLSRNASVILSVDNAAHWVTVIGKTGGRYLVADSWDWYKYGSSNKAVALYTWDQLVNKRWYEECEECEGEGTTECENCEGEGEVECDMCDGDGWVWCTRCDGDGCGYCANEGWKDCKKCKAEGVLPCRVCNESGEVQCAECEGHAYSHYGVAVIPRTARHSSLNAMKRTGKFAELLVADIELQQFWGYLLTDLLDSFGPPAEAGKDALTMKQFLARYGQTIRENMSYWLRGVSDADVARELSYYSVVADAHGIKVPRSKADHCAVTFATAMTTTLMEWYVYN